VRRGCSTLAFYNPSTILYIDRSCVQASAASPLSRCQVIPPRVVLCRRLCREVPREEVGSQSADRIWQYRLHAGRRPELSRMEIPRRVVTSHGVVSQMAMSYVAGWRWWNRDPRPRTDCPSAYSTMPCLIGQLASIEPCQGTRIKEPLRIEPWPPVLRPVQHGSPQRHAEGERCSRGAASEDAVPLHVLYSTVLRLASTEPGRCSNNVTPYSVRPLGLRTSNLSGEGLHACLTQWRQRGFRRVICGVGASQGLAGSVQCLCDAVL
jgi:hypothetical protein